MKTSGNNSVFSECLRGSSNMLACYLLPSIFRGPTCNGEGVELIVLFCFMGLLQNGVAVAFQ